MMKRLFALLLVMALLAGVLSVAVFASDRDLTPDSAGSGVVIDPRAEYAPNRVVILYADGAVDTAAPVGAAAERAQSRALSHRAAAFGASAKSVGPDAVSKAENTLGQQVQILDKSLSRDYVIEDTFVLGTGRSELVISTVSSDSMSTEALVASLQGTAGIRYAEPDYIRRVQNVPEWDDACLSDMHQLFGDNSIHADALWESPDFAEANANSRTEPVVVAVVDTGVDYTHPDLAGRMWTKPSGRAFRNFAGKYGYNFAYESYDPMDDNGDGTHVAGIIAAQANNAEGVVGVAGASDQIQIMAVKVMSGEGGGYNSDILNGLRYVMEMKKAGVNVRVMNCSYGGYGYSDIEMEMIEEAGKLGILSVIAASNDAMDNDLDPVTPANAHSDYRITVAASEENGELASYSNYGRKNVDIVAPGSNILSAAPFANYLPYLYDAGTLRGYKDADGTEHAGNTAYYGAFDGAAVGKAKNAQGETVDTVTPVVGTDHFGNLINEPADPKHRVGTFGASVMLVNRAAGSDGTATLEITEDRAFPLGSHQSVLRWQIKDAKAGDVYILYFPYEKESGNSLYGLASLVYRSTVDPESGASGTLFVGDVKINGFDRYGKADWSTPGADGTGGGYGYFDPIVNSIWDASTQFLVLYPYADVQGADYGLGLVFQAQGDGDCYFDISSMAVPKVDADPHAFGHYEVMSGTSMATPVVAGATAVLSAMYPELSLKELKALVLSATDDRFEGWCTSGGMLDLRELTAPVEDRKPAITEVVADFENGTVTLRGQGFGAAPTVQIMNNISDTEYETVSVNDVSVTEDGVVISRADEVYGIIGSDITFLVENTQNGRTGCTSAYVARGLTQYADAFQMDSDFPVREDPLTGEATYFYELAFIQGADEPLLYDPAGNLYAMDFEEGPDSLQQLGTDVLQAVDAYVQTVREADEDSLWNRAEDYWIWRQSAPTVLDGTVYELIRVQLGYMRGTLLLGLSMDGEPTWNVCYDSLAEFGTAPEDLPWNEIGSATLAGYNGRLYLFGAVLSEESYKGDEDTGSEFDYTEDNILTAVFSCDPAGAGAEGADWRTERAGLAAPRANGVPVVQNEALYYVLSTQSSCDGIDYSVYRFDGSAWSVAGELPTALNYAQLGGQYAKYGMYYYEYPVYEGIACAIAADEEGILFGGASFDGVGDTFRFRTDTGETQPLPYTLWGSLSEGATFGALADGTLWVGYFDNGIGLMVWKALDLDPDAHRSAFSDVEEGDWFCEAVRYGCEQGYFQGVSDTRFNPQGTMSRAMFATVLYRMAGEPSVGDAENPFADVPDGKWYTAPVIWAANEGILGGFSDGEFRPNDDVTREQIVTLLWRFLDQPAAEDADLSDYPDADQISSWAVDAFAWAVRAGIVQGKRSGLLDPRGSASRAEVAQMVMNCDLARATQG